MMENLNLENMFNNNFTQTNTQNKNYNINHRGKRELNKLYGFDIHADSMNIKTIGIHEFDINYLIQPSIEPVADPEYFTTPKTPMEVPITHPKMKPQITFNMQHSQNVQNLQPDLLKDYALNKEFCLNDTTKQSKYELTETMYEF